MPDFRPEDLRPIEAMAAINPAFTENVLRWQLRHRAENGLSDAVVRIGRRHHLIVPRYLDWLARRGSAPASAHGTPAQRATD